MAGHFGHCKTIDLIHCSYHWPGLTRVVKHYIRSCTVCARSKANRHKPYGFLKQLPIPPHPWESISMDFIKQLPTSEGNTAILVIVDRLTKQSSFTPTHDSIDSLELTQLFLPHVFSKHGTPSHVTSNRGSEFVSHFFRSLGKLLQMELHFMSGYHPEGDGQTEHLNQVLEQYLRAYTNYQQDDWSSLLPLVEFAYNNATNKTTGVSLFFANKGYHPSLMVEPNVQVSSIGAQRFISDLDNLHTELKRSIAKAQECYQKYTDEHRSLAPLLKIGNRVYVKAKYFCTTQLLKKLSEKNLGPYKVITIPRSHLFTLHLPDHFCSAHPIFHISQLEPVQPDPFPQCDQPPPPPVEINGNIEYEVSEILDSKMDRCFWGNRVLRYLVHWMGYEGMEEETSWISAQDLEHAQDVAWVFHRRYPSKPGPTDP